VGLELGAIFTWDDHLDRFRHRLRLADELGYRLVGIGESPPSYHDPYLALSLAASDTRQALIGPMVTSPVLRHPVVNVSGMSAVQELSGGRAVLGVGAGNSIAYGIGQPQPKQHYVAEYLRTLRALFAGEAADWEGGRVLAPPLARSVPVFYSALGPKALTVAGQAADGAIVQVGQSIDEVRQRIRTVREAAAGAGRDPEAITIWAYSVCAVGETRAEALHQLAPYLASNAPVLAFSAAAMERVPDELRPAVLEMQRRYDFTAHVAAGGRNGEIAEELGLLDFLAGFRTIAGTREQLQHYFQELARSGVALLMTAANGQPDVDRMLIDIVGCAQ
jgi:alkanesulfonate monooxygenase SsuD/methylene tetrahydromethanopterin reductase-like flavin-dependent oxidoreductase (luciferase family)